MAEAPVFPKPALNLYERIHAKFELVGGIDLDLPPREPGRERPISVRPNTMDNLLIGY